MDLDDRLRYELEESVKALQGIVKKMPIIFQQQIGNILIQLGAHYKQAREVADEIRGLSDQIALLIGRLERIVKHRALQDEELLTRPQAAKMLGVSKRSHPECGLLNLVKRGYVEVVRDPQTGYKKYLKSSIINYIEENKVRSNDTSRTRHKTK
jgi:hypothetical protein